MKLKDEKRDNKIMGKTPEGPRQNVVVYARRSAALAERHTHRRSGDFVCGGALFYQKSLALIIIIIIIISLLASK